uniref:Uncharacterized protein n=1 Tax=Anguilla anguilla TaxID=7936 RepID=A0A0E9VVP0_ANGAN
MEPFPVFRGRSSDVLQSGDIVKPLLVKNKNAVTRKTYAAWTFISNKIRNKTARIRGVNCKSKQDECTQNVSSGVFYNGLAVYGNPS